MRQHGATTHYYYTVVLISISSFSLGRDYFLHFFCVYVCVCLSPAERKRNKPQQTNKQTSTSGKLFFLFFSFCVALHPYHVRVFPTLFFFYSLFLLLLFHGRNTECVLLFLFCFFLFFFSSFFSFPYERVFVERARQPLVPDLTLDLTNCAQLVESHTIHEKKEKKEKEERHTDSRSISIKSKGKKMKKKKRNG